MLTLKQEDFCRVYVELGNASAAYRQAYNAEKMKPDSINRMAHELLKNLKIASRIKELRAPVREATQITLVSRLEDLKKLRDKAVSHGQLSAAINAEIARGKVVGLYVDKQEITGKGGGPVMLDTPKVFVQIKRRGIRELCHAYSKSARLICRYCQPKNLKKNSRAVVSLNSQPTPCRITRSIGITGLFVMSLTRWYGATLGA